MASLITIKAKEYFALLATRQAEIAKKEAEFESNGQKDPKLAFLLMQDHLNALSYPLGAYDLCYAYQLPAPEAWFGVIRSLWVKMLYYGEIAFLPYLDVTFSEIEEKLETLEPISVGDKLLCLQKASLLIAYAKTFSAMHSKMSFVWIDLMGRLSILMKNSINYAEVFPALALNHPDHEATSAILSLVENSLSQTAESLRRRYELKDQTGDDLEKALVYLNVQRQIYGISNNVAEMDKVQKKHDVWQAKLSSDRKAQKESEVSS